MTRTAPIKIGSEIVAMIGDERITGVVENIELTPDGGKYGTAVDSAVAGQDSFVFDIPGRFVYSYQLQYVDGVWVGV